MSEPGGAPVSPAIPAPAPAARRPASQRKPKEGRLARSRRKVLFWHVEHMRRRARQNFDLFLQLQSLDISEKETLAGKVRACANFAAVISTLPLTIMGPISIAIYGLALAPLLSAPLLTNLWLRQQHTTLEWVLLYLAYFGLLGTLFYGVYRPLEYGSLPPERRRYNMVTGYLFSLGGAVSLTIAVAAGILFFSPALARAIPDLPWLPLVLHMLFASAFSLCCFLAALLVIYAWLGLVYLLVWSPFSRRYAGVQIAFRLLELVSYLEKKRGWWGHPAYTQNVLDHLEYIAGLLERDLPLQAQSKDLATDAWAKKVGREMAAAVRARKKWLLTPKPDSQEQLLQATLRDFISAASGNWDAFSRVEPEPVTVQSVYGWAQRIAAALLRGALPLALIWVGQRWLFTIPEPLAGNLWLGGILWLILSVLLELDPNIKDKLDVLQRFKNLSG